MPADAPEGPPAARVFSNTTGRRPRCVRKYAIDEPVVPAPITATS